MNINAYATLVYQSPYKGFNREAKKQKYGVSRDRLNPPIRGSIGKKREEFLLMGASQSPNKGFNSYQDHRELLRERKRSQSPYKGFNSLGKIQFSIKNNCLNPPIRGSIVSFELLQQGVKLSQSPYKGFNSWSNLKFGFKVKGNESQSPYKGFNRTR